MNWDEKLTKACQEKGGTQHPATDNALAGALWMREHMRTDEAIEQVAETLYRHDHPRPWPYNPWAALVQEWQDKYRNKALAAINALLGED